MSQIEAKVHACFQCIDALVRLFVRVRVNHYWPSAYNEILDALKELDVDRAIELEAAVPKGGMGGLYDLYICKEKRSRYVRCK